MQSRPLCLPKDSATGACYNSQTGDCGGCAREDCQPPYEPPGMGSSCPDSVQPGPPLTPVYRLWSPTRSFRFYTISGSEKQLLLDNCARVGVRRSSLVRASASAEDPRLTRARYVSSPA